MPSVPDHLVYPLDEFADEFERTTAVGLNALKCSRVAFTGLARNCATWLGHNLTRLEMLAEHCGSWCLHLETNDNADDTVGVLEHFCGRHAQASYRNQTLNRQHFSAEFAGPRTIALAEYRAACQAWVRQHATDADFVAVIDWDAWGGWSHAGFIHGIGALIETPDAYGMATVSLMQHYTLARNDEGTAELQPAWLGYDAWAFRLNAYTDMYTRGVGGWFHQWLPFVGSEPIKVCSAFGGLCIYRAADYLRGVYDGTKDCEHTSFHRTITEATGRHLYYNPSQRTVMRWLENATDETGQHGDD